MRESERVEAGHRRIEGSYSNGKSSTTRDKTGEPRPIFGNLQIKKLTPAERQVCMKDERCFDDFITDVLQLFPKKGEGSEQNVWCAYSSRVTESTRTTEII